MSVALHCLFGTDTSRHKAYIEAWVDNNLTINVYCQDIELVKPDVLQLCRLTFIRLLFLFMEHHDQELTNNIFACVKFVWKAAC